MAALRIGQERRRRIDPLAEVVAAEEQVAEHCPSDAIHLRLGRGQPRRDPITSLLEGDEPGVEESKRPGEDQDQCQPDRQERGGESGGSAQNIRPANRAGDSVTARMKPTTATTMAPRNAAPKSATR